MKILSTVKGLFYISEFHKESKKYENKRSDL